MMNYLLVLVTSLFLVPWGLCLPRDHSGLEARADPPDEFCPDGAISPDLPLWVPRTDPLVAIEILVETGGLKGYYMLVVDVNAGVANASASHLTGTDVDISPYYDSGTTVVHEDANTSNYQLWVDSVNQTTPNFVQGAKDYNFAGVWPRVDMQVNRTGHADYFLVAWLNPYQGATGVALNDYEWYHCGPAK